MPHVALVVPLALLAVAGLRQRDRAGVPRVEVLHEPLDGPALPGGVTTLEQQDVLGLGVGGPVLELQQLDLEQVLLLVVLLARQPLVVRVVLAPGVDGKTVRADEHRVVVVVLADRVPVDVQPVDVLADVAQHVCTLGSVGAERYAVQP